MRKKLFKKWFLFLSLLCKRTINLIQGKRLTYKGERLRNYLIKVFVENYTPQTMTDYEDEKAFNPEELKNEARMQKAGKYLIALMEYP